MSDKKFRLSQKFLDSLNDEDMEYDEPPVLGAPKNDELPAEEPTNDKQRKDSTESD